MTQWVLRALEGAAEIQKQYWIDASWNEGSPDPVLKTVLFARADAYRATNETTYERYCELNGDDPIFE